MKYLIILFCINLLCSCAVSQWQREHLSDPIMELDEDEESKKMKEHIQERYEGSSGSSDQGGGGCGC